MNFKECQLRLSFFRLFEYLEATPASRCILEGEEIINSNFLILCGVMNGDKNIFDIFSLCLQTSALKCSPHEINGSVLWEENTLLIKKFICSCKAGNSGKCKHIAAVLIHLSRYKLSELELVAQTDVKCMWNKQKEKNLQNFEPVPLLDTKCFSGCNRDESFSEMSDEAKHKLKTLFMQSNSNSALMKSTKRTRQLDQTPVRQLDQTQSKMLDLDSIEEHAILLNLKETEIGDLKMCCQNTYHTLFSDINVNYILKVTRTNKKRWNEERQYKITGSRCYEIYTYSKDDWENKARKYFWPKYFQNKNMQYGIVTEKEARDIYRKNLGYTVVETGLIVNKSNPWLAYSPDGIVLDKNNNPIRLLEIKCPVAGQEYNALECFPHLNYLKIINNRISLNPRHKYYGQVQLGMLLLNVNICDLIIYSSKSKTFLNINVAFDEEFIKNMVTRLKLVYFHKMLHILCMEMKQ